MRKLGIIIIILFCIIIVVVEIIYGNRVEEDNEKVHTNQNSIGGSSFVEEV
jgi:preprotein translocase subunit SecG